MTSPDSSLVPESTPKPTGSDGPSCAVAAGSEARVTCPLCDGEGEITNPAHPDHPANTHDGEDETWCLACEGDCSITVRDGVVSSGRYAGEQFSQLEKWRAHDGPPNNPDQQRGASL